MAERRRATIASGIMLAVFAILAVVVVVAAVRSDGLEATNVDLHDGSVWTLRDDGARLVRVNARTREFDIDIPIPRRAADAGKSEVDLVQDGEDVFVLTSNRVMAWSPASPTLQDVGLDVPVGASFVVGHGNAAMLRADGSLHVAAAARLSEEFAEDVHEQFEPGATIAIARSGRIAIVDVRTGAVRTFDPGDGTTSADLLPGPTLDFGGPLVDAEITMIGEMPVAISDRFLVTTSGLRVPVGDSARLQLAGPARRSALVSTPDSLLSVDLVEGEVTTLVSADEGRPIRPAVGGDCSYAAWEITGEVWVRCEAEGRKFRAAPDQAASWRFRMNRDQVVLETTFADSLVMTPDGLIGLEDWSDVARVASVSVGADAMRDEPADAERATCARAGRPPVARPDRYEVSARRTIELRPLDNDLDADCDPTSIVEVRAEDPQAPSLRVVDHGRALLLAPGGPGSTFHYLYTIEDRDGETAEAVITVDRYDGPNRPPRPTTAGAARPVVAVGGSTSVSVLDHWFDPDGDPLSVHAAVAESGEAIVLSDGSVEYQASGSGVGPAELRFWVWDGVHAPVEDLVTVDIVDPGSNLPPIARHDFITTQAGSTTLIDAVANDDDPNGDPLVMVGHRAPDEVEVRPAADGAALYIASQRVGIHHVSYDVTDGSEVSTATIRLTVVDRAATNRQPAPLSDTATVGFDQAVIIDPLRNDSDPDGDPLAVTEIVRVGPPSPTSGDVRVDIIDQNVIWLEPGQAAIGFHEFLYTVNDGRGGTADARLTVRVVDGPRSPPIVRSDRAVVRAGAVVRVDVLGNDRDPLAAQLEVTSVRAVSPDTAGVLWLEGNDVRFRAGSDPGEVRVEYSVAAKEGREAPTSNGELVIDVIGADEENRPPIAPPVFLRVVEGRSATLRVPSGTDPDGDVVEFRSVAPGRSSRRDPTGTASISSRSLRFDAVAGGAGTQRFTYVIADSRGARAEGELAVMVLPLSNRPPTLVSDLVVARPGSELALDVLANDLDADLDALRLLSIEGDPAVGHRVEGGLAFVALPAQEEAVWQLRYSATDGRSSPRSGLLTVVTERNAPKFAPVARDDPDDGVELQLRAEASGAVVADVDVVRNDHDPDGPRAGLRVSIPPGQRTDASVKPGTNHVTAVLSDRPTTVAYMVTDADGHRAHAVVHVPAAPAVGTAPVEGPGAEQVDVAVTPIPQTDVDPPESSANAVGNRPPVVRPIDVEFEEGGDVVSIDLVGSGLADDPDGDPLSFQLVESADGFDVELTDRGLLTATSPSLQPGAVGTVTIGVADGRAAVVVSEVIVRVLPTSRPVVTLAAIEVDAVLGQPRRVEPLRGVVNPFPGRPLRLVDAQLTGGTGQLDFDGSSVTYTADDTSAAEVRYVVEDGTGRTERHVVGSVRFRVTTPTTPSPSAPTILDVGSSSVLLDWEPIAGQSEVVDYIVTIHGGDRDGERLSVGRVTSTTVAGLSSGVQYSFSISSVFRGLGEGPPSVPSATVVVGDVPPRPNPPEIVAVDDGSLTISWDPVFGGPSADSYLVVSSEGDRHPVIGSTTLEWDGLVNGRLYTFVVVAVNRAGPSLASEPSDAVAPATVPNAPRSVGHRRIGDARNARVSVHWLAPESNGRAITSYLVREFPVDGSPAKEHVATSTSLELDIVPGSHPRFDLRAVNEMGESPPSELTDVFVAAVAPGAPASLQVVASDQGAEVIAQRPASHGGFGFEALHYEYRLDGGSHRLWRGGGSNGTIGDLVNGQQYEVSVRACHDVYCGPYTPDVAFTPFGPLRAGAWLQPREVGWVGTTLAVEWNWDARPAENGRPIRVRVQGSGVSSTQPVGAVVTEYQASAGPQTVTMVITDDESTTADVYVTSTVDVGSPASAPRRLDQQCGRQKCSASAGWKDRVG